MDLKVINGDGKKSDGNVITLQEVSTRFRHDKCQHRKLLVCEEKFHVECGDCGERLDPVYALIRLAREESRLRQLIEGKKQLVAEIEQKNRCKCDKCGQMTRIVK